MGTIKVMWTREIVLLKYVNNISFINLTAGNNSVPSDVCVNSFSHYITLNTTSNLLLYFPLTLLFIKNYYTEPLTWSFNFLSLGRLFFLRISPEIHYAFHLRFTHILLCSITSSVRRKFILL